MQTSRSQPGRKAVKGSVKRAANAVKQLMSNTRFLLPVNLPDGTTIMLLPDVHLALETRLAGPAVANQSHAQE